MTRNEVYVKTCSGSHRQRNIEDLFCVETQCGLELIATFGGATENACWPRFRFLLGITSWREIDDRNDI